MAAPPPPQPSPPLEPGLKAVVATATGCRLLLNTARRFVYPFAPALSRGMGIPLGAVTSLIAVNQATAILGLVFGPLSDRLGYRPMMLAALGMLAVGMLAAAALPVYALLVAALFLAGLGKTVFDAALQAWVGQRVPFQRRGQVIGIMELAWAGSTLAGIPLIGLLIAWQGWRAPFLVLGILAVVGLAAAARVLPPAGKGPAPAAGLFDSLGPLLRDRAALGALFFGFFVSAANENLFVVYGAWLETDFSLGIVSLGLSTIVIGGAEMTGELFTAGFADRLGLKRTAAVSLVVSTIGYALLPLIARTLPMALAGLFLIFLSLELTIVTFLSLCTELRPQNRATMMAAFWAASGAGRIAGALIGVPIWTGAGLSGTASASAALSATALAAFLAGLGRWRPPVPGRS